MRNWKKSLLASMATMMVVGVVATACSSDKAMEKSGGNVDSDSKAAVKLNLLGPGKTHKQIKFEEREKYPVWQETIKLFDEAGLDLAYEIVPNEQYSVVIKTRMATGSDLPDIVNISRLDNTTVLNLAKQGVLLDLNPLIEKYSNGNIMKMYNDEFPFAKKATTSPDGKMYWFSNLHKKTYEGSKPAPVGLTMLIRKDWLEKLQLPVPTTAEQYMQTLIDIRENDANGNGQKDEVLVYDPSNFSGAIAQWFGLGTDISAVDIENKKVVSPWYQEGIKDYFRYLQQLVEAGVLDTSLIGGSSEQRQQKITENQVASLHDYNMIEWYEPTIKGGGEFLPLMPLKAHPSIVPAAQVEPPYLVWEKYAITKDAKNVEAAIKFFDTVYSEPYARLVQWGIEGKTYTLGESGMEERIDAGSEAAKAETGNVVGKELYGDTVFPRVQFDNVESEIKGVKQPKGEHQLKIMDYKPYYVNMNHNYLAIPDDEQLERKTKILTNLNTYSSELATKLALGQKSLDNWDDYMADLKKLGLDELLEIDQYLHDRYNSIQ
ncbi:extracellular solute-binding protein [Paenibacillus sp. J5C_2022]|uniref:extracellular solute-binding protein n=1 Tax=Paenibacillus sp. J5C2022 TaxID=2977129 RepID=UPI0021D072D5|nr:extracellular solute-binding protein [Paenibacillus sp. J5C2022]MCU6709104.1 extracellular solute-binding protein [Paenibacillus sp. J5C2022]